MGSQRSWQPTFSAFGSLDSRFLPLAGAGSGARTGRKVGGELPLFNARPLFFHDPCKTSEADLTVGFRHHNLQFSEPLAKLHHRREFA